MKQMSLTTTGFELVHKRTRKCEFLDEMELVVPWVELIGLIERWGSYGALCVGTENHNKADQRRGHAKKQ